MLFTRKPRVLKAMRECLLKTLWDKEKMGVTSWGSKPVTTNLKYLSLVSYSSSLLSVLSYGNKSKIFLSRKEYTLNKCFSSQMEAYVTQILQYGRKHCGKRRKC